jgi:hypothetical protein
VVEHVTFNHVVLGSIPRGPTTLSTTCLLVGRLRRLRPCDCSRGRREFLSGVCPTLAEFHLRQRPFEPPPAALQGARRRRDIRVPEEVAHVVLGRAGLEQPARELATQVVEVEMRNAGAGAGRRVPFF